jgi:iron complex transport system substrate-binding protein
MARIAVRPDNGRDRWPTALIYEVGGLTSGPGSLADDALTQAGFRNLARDLGIGTGGRVELEALLTRPPDLLVLAAEAGEFRTVAADNLRHPAIIWLGRTHRSITVPWRSWLCATPAVADAIERLATARQALRGGPRRP